MSVDYKSAALRSRRVLRLLVIVGLTLLLAYVVSRRPEEKAGTLDTAGTAAATSTAGAGATIDSPAADAGEIVLVTGPCPTGFVKLAPLERRAPCFTACDASAECPRGLACIDEDTATGAR